MMTECARRELAHFSRYLQRLMYRPIRKFSRAAAEEAQLRVGPEAAVFDPAPEEVVLPANEESRNRGSEKRNPIICNAIFDGVCRLSEDVVPQGCAEIFVHFFIGVQSQNPIGCRLFDRRILLCGVAFPLFHEDIRAE